MSQLIHIIYKKEFLAYTWFPKLVKLLLPSKHKRASKPKTSVKLHVAVLT